VFDGRLDVESPADAGTLVAAAIPLAGLTDGEDCRAHPNKQ
jgi:hypothetical protein